MKARHSAKYNQIYDKIYYDIDMEDYETEIDERRLDIICGKTTKEEIYEEMACPYGLKEFLHGYCDEFANVLKDKLPEEFEIKSITDTDGRLIHAFCEGTIEGVTYYADARGITNSWEEFSNEFANYYDYNRMEKVNFPFTDKNDIINSGCYLDGTIDRGYSSAFEDIIEDFIDSNSLIYNFNKMKNINVLLIPNDIEKLDFGETFHLCCQEALDPSDIDVIILPEGIKELDDAFYGFAKMEYIKIPESVEKIQNGTFADCENLHRISMMCPTNLINDINVFDYCPDNLIIQDANGLEETIDEIENKINSQIIEINKAMESVTEDIDIDEEDLDALGA